MRKVRIALGSKDIYKQRLNIEDYKPIYQVLGETPMTVIIKVRGEKRVFNKSDIEYSE